MLLPLSHLIALLSAPFVLPCLVSSEQNIWQQPLTSHEECQTEPEFRVAIIGAGISGASAAYHLRNQSTVGTLHKGSFTITIYESSDEVGGYVKTITPQGYDGRLPKPVELGPSSFLNDDWCLVEAARATHTDLSQSQYNREADARWILNRGQFLEDRFCARFDITPRFWRWKEVKKSVNRTLDWLGFELVHQFRPWRLRRRLHALQERFYQFGRNSIFENVLRELGESGLKGDVVSSTASKFLESQGITRDLQKIYLEPCIKESFGLELDEAVGLHAVLASGTSRSEFPISATDGNQRFIERLIDESEANLQLGLRVVRVEPGKRRRYALTVTSSASGGNEERLEYDAVIATGNALRSLQSVNSRASQGQETTTYKTYFSTTSSLNPDAIGADSKNVPRSVLFTAEAAAGLANSYKSPIGLTSLTTWPEFYIDRTGCRFDDECDQWTNMYMAESSSPLSKNILYQLTRKDDDISWARSHPWRRNLPLVNSSAPSLGDIQVEHLLFDAGNPVIDTMEMSCRMGRNIALKLFEQRLSAIPAFGGDNL